MIPWTPATRIVRGATGVSVSWQPVDADGEPADHGGTTTVAVTTSDGTAVVGVGAVSGDGDTGERSATLPDSAVTAVEWLDVTWSIDGTAVLEETVEIAGGVLGSFADITADDPNLAKLDASVIQRHRKAIEDLVFRVTRRSPFERFYRERVNGSGRDRILTSFPDVTAVVWAREYDDDGTTTTSLDATELAAIAIEPGGMLIRRDGNVWDLGRRNWEIGYRWGWAGSMPHDLRLDLYRAVRARLLGSKTATPIDRSTSYTDPDGTVYDLATPGDRQWTTGIPAVDEALNGYAFKGAGLG